MVFHYPSPFIINYLFQIGLNLVFINYPYLFQNIHLQFILLFKNKLSKMLRYKIIIICDSSLKLKTSLINQFQIL